MNKKLLILGFSFAFLVFSFEFAFAASIDKTSQADFTVSGSSFESTTATIETGNIILELSGAEALWTTNGITICAATDIQTGPQMISDGSGGAIIAWADRRSGVYDIYAQRIDSDGNPQWTANGEAVCTATNMQYFVQLISDGSGGAIITWRDSRGADTDIYAQRIDSDGSIHAGWTANGEVICTATGSQTNPQIISDGSGGAIITWEDSRGADTDIYAQRIDSDGSIHAGWTANGEVICTATGNQAAPQLISDGSGGAIITWRDDRVAGTDIYAQRIDSDGSIHAGWTANGEAVCAAVSTQDNPQLISDGGGGAIITWEDDRGAGADTDIYAQRIDGDGSIFAGWAANGEAICTTPEGQYAPQLTSDGNSGAIITWGDYRSVAFADIYARRIDSSGNPQWTNNGVAICTAANDQLVPQLTSDGNRGAIITWVDWRSAGTDVYAQRIDGDGIIHTGWITNGVTISAATGVQEQNQIVSDGNTGAIIVWTDSSLGNIYAQRIEGVYFPSGRYISEKIENTDSFLGWSTLSWTGSGSIAAEVKTATSSSGLDTASWVPVSNAGDIPNRDNINYKWIQTRMSFTPSDLNTTTPRLNSFSINYDTNTTPPSVSNVQFNGVSVSSGDVINPSPSIEATITDTAPGVDPGSIVITIDGTDYAPDSFTSGVMSYTVATPLSSSSTHNISIRASDYANNISTWEATGLRVLEGTQATNVINVPNPFNPNTESTNITYQLSEDTAVTIYIYTTPHPELIRRIVIAPPAEGAHTGANSVAWGGKNQNGAVVPNGVYFYQIVANNKVIGSGNIIVLK
jgi:hypothetical protein